LTADLIAPHTRGRGIAWPGRASRGRREQVLEQSPDTDSPVHPLWTSLVDVLAAIDGPSSALLATETGDAVAVHGLTATDAARVARQSRAAFAARATPGDASTVETVDHTVGLRHTVIASVPSTARPGHLLTVTAQGVSLQVLEAWTHRLADDIQQALSGVDS
jgi:hypothetical protein